MALNNDQLEKMVIDLKKEVGILKNKIVETIQILPKSLNGRQIKDGVLYIQAGTAAEIPDGEIPSQGVMVYYETDTKKFKVYNRDTEDWDEVSLT